jgi:biopolymer transport protein ExbD
MEFPARRRARRDRENVVPLINVVFLLLIFFLLAGTLRSPDRFQIDPPAGRLGEAAAPGEMVVLLGPRGRLALDGEEMDLRGIEVRLAGADGPAPPVQLRADAAAAAGDLLPLLEALRRAGVERIELAIREGD